MVLLAICDANYYFTMFDLGQYDSNNDSHILVNSQMLESGDLNVPTAHAKAGIESLLLSSWGRNFSSRIMVNVSLPRANDGR